MSVHTLEIELSDVRRGRYESLSVTVAQHPSESMPYLVTRVLAYALELDEGLAFSKGGLGDADEPALSVTDLTQQTDRSTAERRERGPPGRPRTRWRGRDAYWARHHPPHRTAPHRTTPPPEETRRELDPRPDR